jgi:antitoxin component YwqK of YwqJK toxin-antitoxin module
MKKLLTILCLVLLFSYSYSKEVIPESQGETGSSKGPQRVYKYKAVRESGYYKKRPYERFYENGQLEQRGNLKNKEPDGLWEWFHKNGQLEQRRTYNNGETDGLWEGYYENGQLQLRGNFKNGKLDGPYETFHLYQNIPEDHPFFRFCNFLFVLIDRCPGRFHKDHLVFRF